MMLSTSSTCTFGRTFAGSSQNFSEKIVLYNYWHWLHIHVFEHLKGKHVERKAFWIWSGCIVKSENKIEADICLLGSFQKNPT